MCSSMLIACACLASFSADQDEAMKVRVYQAALSDWLSNTNYLCTYEVTAGHVSMLERAEQGILDSGGTVKSEGRVVRRGSLLRYLNRFPDGPTLASEDKEAGIRNYAHTTEEDISNGEVTVHYSPKKSEMFNGSVSAGLVSTQPTVIPFAPSSPLYRRTNDFVSSASLAHAKSARVYNLADDAVRVDLLQIIGPGGEKESLSFTLWMKPERPVPLKLVYRRESAVGVVMEMGCVLGEFTTDANHVTLPRRMVNYSRVARMQNYQVLVWRSADIGKRDPTDSDFVLDLDPTDSVAGLRFIPRYGPVRSIDVAKLTALDLGGEREPDGTAIREAPRSNSKLLIAVNSVFLVMTLGFFGVRRLRKR